MKSLLLGLSLSLVAAGTLSAQVIYYSGYTGYAGQHTAYPDNWSGGPPISSPGGQAPYVAQYYTNSATPAPAYGVTYIQPQITKRGQLLVPTYRTNVGNHRLLSGPCGWGGNCTTYDGPGFTYIHPAQQ